MERMMDKILNQLEGVRKNGNGYTAQCPAHLDRSPSLSIAEGDDGRILLHCFSGCTVNQICDALGLKVEQLFPDQMNYKQKKQCTEYQRRQNLERKYEILEQFAFVAMAEFRDLTKQIFKEYGLDIPDELVPAVHKLPVIEFYMETLSTGTSEQKLELLREGVIAKWARLYSPNMTCQLSRTHN